MSETSTDRRKVLSPFDKRECLTLRQAAAVAGKSEATMRVWSDQFGLGRRVGGGSWSVSKVAGTSRLCGPTTPAIAQAMLWRRISGERWLPKLARHKPTCSPMKLRELEALSARLIGKAQHAVNRMLPNVVWC